MRLTAEAADAAARAELWFSFGSLLRAYTAAASFGGNVPLGVVSGPESGTLLLEGVRRGVRLTVDAATGTGDWVLEEAPRSGGAAVRLDGGAFCLGLDGTLTWGARQDGLAMDVLAEMLVTLVVEQ